jgi:hypothetical protein
MTTPDVDNLPVVEEFDYGHCHAIIRHNASGIRLSDEDRRFLSRATVEEVLEFYVGVTLPYYGTWTRPASHIDHVRWDYSLTECRQGLCREIDSDVEDESYFNRLLARLALELGSKLAILRPGTHSLDLEGVTLVIIDDQHNAGLAAFEPALLDQLLRTTAIFHNEHPPFEYRGYLKGMMWGDEGDERFLWVAQEMADGLAPFPGNRQVLRPPGLAVMLAVPGEPDAWIDRWEAAGLYMYTGRQLMAEWNDAFKAAAKYGLSPDETLRRIGWVDLDDLDELPF